MSVIQLAKLKAILLKHILEDSPSLNHQFGSIQRKVDLSEPSLIKTYTKVGEYAICIHYYGIFFQVIVDSIEVFGTEADSHLSLSNLIYFEEVASVVEDKVVLSSDKLITVLHDTVIRAWKRSRDE